MLKLAEKYPKVLKDNLKGCKAFEDQPYKTIDLDQTKQPFYETRIKTTPHHIRKEAELYIKNLIDEDIIEVQREVTDWCSPGFFVTRRGSNKPRFVIDYRRLNECIKRPHWNFLSSDQVRKSLPGKGGYIITCDLKMGFHQIHLPKESRDLTTFNCEYGKYRWKRYPQGLSSSGDIFNLHVDVEMHLIPKHWYSKCVDDILIIGKNKQECFKIFEEICKILKKTWNGS